MHLSDKNIVITGASKGLGRELALRLAPKRVNLILVARTKKLLEQVQLEIKQLTGRTPLIIPCDISDENQVRLMAGIIRRNYRHVDVLINNAGIAICEPVGKLSNNDMRKQFEVNFFGTYYCTKELLALIIHSEAGYILNIGSILSELSFSATSVYSATKAALSVFSQGLRCQCKKSRVKVGLFLPGPMRTSFQSNRKENTLDTPDFLMLDPQKSGCGA
jgi:short-subunit dehydrogenase